MFKGILSLAIFIGLLFIPAVPNAIPIILYVIAVILRINEKVGNYRDYVEKNKKDEEIEVTNETKKAALNGAIRSSNFEKGINNIKENYAYERKREERKFWKELFEVLILQ